jgi:hypothetical protein
MYQYLEREQEREAEAGWGSEPTDCMTREEWLAELEAERQAHAESRMYYWLKGGAL